MRLGSVVGVVLVGKFQSTHPHGVRHCQTGNTQSAVWFQSTHPHGVRHHDIPCPRGCDGFNPRTRMGCDLTRAFPGSTGIVSIHAPAWGATALLFLGYLHDIVSIHAPAWGATTICRRILRPSGVSIHAPAWGATHNEIPASDHASVSIHAPAWGATL